MVLYSLHAAVGQVIKKKTEMQYRQAAWDTAYKYSLIVREPGGTGTGGDNKHWAIARFNKPLGINLRSAYCSTFGLYSYRAAGLYVPGIDGRAYSWRKPKNMVWHRGWLAISRELWPTIQLMDAVVMNWSHVEFVGYGPGKSVGYSTTGVYTIAGNTTGGNKKRGEGVFSGIFRDYNNIQGIYNHITPYYSTLK